ncbi:DKNYY domain-containing protein [Aquimarina algicola]|uniref:WG repeat-containing protein n=1 Tax=Aquimarina algicola TaxID=2589995 RepID=A0A504JJW6_9FLAO|nr:DKNYY domain-containing protein [Aquimarina algicola]TPN86801.1 hypothetical protein FHK87_04140 [Aquimarina algicola]
MKKYLIILCILPIISFSQVNKVLKIEEPTINNNIKVPSSTLCRYTREDTYTVNEDFVLFTNCTTQKKLYPDMNSFHIPEDNVENYFALDKDAVYFRGKKIKTNSTDFKIIGFDGSYLDENKKVYWKTKNAVYKNTKKLKVFSDPSTLINLTSIKYNVYFKDDNNVYYKETKIEQADPKTIKNEYYNDFAYDKNNSYLKGEIITYDNEKIIPIGHYNYFRTAKHLLRLNDSVFMNLSQLDVNSFKLLGTKEYRGCYMMDKNHIYLETPTVPLPIKKEKLKNIKVWSGHSRAYYVSDGEHVFFRDHILKGIDAKTFGVLEGSKYFYDKNGVYDGTYRRNTNGVGFRKIPFNYKIPISESSIFLDDYGNVIYEQQACLGHYLEFYFENLTPKEVQLAKESKLNIKKGGNHVIIEKKVLDQEFYSDLLYKNNDKIYFQDQETIADADTFKRVDEKSSIYLFKDIENIYYFKQNKGLIKVEGIDNKTLGIVFDIFLKDKNYIYYYNKKIISSKDISLIGIYKFNGLFCGVGGVPEDFDYYLFKNLEGYWLVKISNKFQENVTIRHLGKKLRNNWKISNQKAKNSCRQNGVYVTTKIKIDHKNNTCNKVKNYYRFYSNGMFIRITATCTTTIWDFIDIINLKNVELSKEEGSIGKYTIENNLIKFSRNDGINFLGKFNKNLTKIQLFDFSDKYGKLGKHTENIEFIKIEGLK